MSININTLPGLPFSKEKEDLYIILLYLRTDFNPSIYQGLCGVAEWNARVFFSVSGYFCDSLHPARTFADGIFMKT